jgi:predicted small secreted protein
MRKPLLLLLLLVLAGCSKGAEADLQYIGQARSAAAEWALVNEQATEGKLTATYVDSMHKWIRQELQTSLSSLSEPQSSYGQDIQELIRQPANAPPADLRAYAARLKQIEDRLESA